MLWRTGLCEPMVPFGSKAPYILLYISTYFSFLWGGVGGGQGQVVCKYEGYCI